MIKNYLKIGLRNLSRNKGYSFINISGLSLGMSVAILIGLWVHDELTYNRYHKNYDRVGQLMKTGFDPDGTPWAGGTSLQFPLVDVLRTQYGNNFKHLVEAVQPSSDVLRAGEANVSATGQYMADGAADMLSLEMISGSSQGLSQPYSILLNASTALKLFGRSDATGRVVKVNSDLEVTVAGVYRDVPQNSQFHELQYILPIDLAAWVKKQDWRNHFLHIYYQIAEDKTSEEVQANVGPALNKAIANLEGLDELRSQKAVISLLPMKDWHLRSNFSWPNYGKPDEGPSRMVWLVALIGAFVLVLACINFMNLSTARSERRAREVGIRKSMGSFRRQLVGQFFAESYLVVLLSFAVSLLLTALALPWFNDLSGKEVDMPWGNLSFWMAVLAFVFVTGLLAGSYPALYLSSFNPVNTLKGTFRTGRLASVPRQVLVVVQFTVSVALIISTITVYKQILFAKDRPVGYTREGLILIHKKSNDFLNKADVLREELKRTGTVEELSESFWKITRLWSNNNGFTWPGKDMNIEENFGTLGIAAEFGRTMKWQFVDGRDFSSDILSDSSALVINESAARYMGMDVAVGQVIHWTNENNKIDKDFRIVGVIKDMIMDSPYLPVKPSVFFLTNHLNYMNVRLRPDVNRTEALSAVATVFNKIIPSAPFDYEFADDAYAQKFAAEDRIAALASVFAVLAVLISCLGLFGLASFVAEKRTKEIGIRKIVGATVLNLWRMLATNFVILILISSLLAIPITYLSLSSWLAQYQYRTGLSPWIFVGSVLGAILLTLATVSYQAVRVARMSPAESLKAND